MWFTKESELISLFLVLLHHLGTVLGKSKKLDKENGTKVRNIKDKIFSKKTKIFSRRLQKLHKGM